MLVDVIHPNKMVKKELDQYLKKGWFRLGQALFTTNFLHFDGVIYSAVWMRIVLAEFEFNETQKKIIKRNKGFIIVKKKFDYTKEKEDLFQKYRSTLKFKTSDSLNLLLEVSNEHSIFDTYEINVFDGSKLIAVGVIDLGEQAAQGIVSFFDPDYKKYSLGKFLVIHKIKLLQELNFELFYPGYFVPDYSFFDYKLEISKNASYYFNLKTKKWRNNKTFKLSENPVKKIENKLNDLSNILGDRGLTHLQMIYDYFDINMNDMFNGFGLLEFPIFIYCYTGVNNQETLFIYDPEKDIFQFVSCSKEYSIPSPIIRDGHYYNYILKIAKVVFEDNDPNVLVDKILDLS